MRGRGRALIATVALALSPAVALPRDGDVAGMTPLARLFTGLPHRVVWADPYAFVGLDTGVEVFDVSDLAAPSPIGHVYLPSPAYDLVVAGTFLFVANGESGLAVVDVGDPADPVLAAALAPPAGSSAEARGIALAGSFVYLAESATKGATDYGLRIVEVTLPASPTERGYVPLDNGALAVSVSAGTAFVGLGSELGGRNGLIAIDVSLPAAAAEIPGSFVATGIAVNQVALLGGVALVAAGDQLAGAFLSVDVTPPSAPAVMDSEALTNGAMGLSLAPGLAYVAMRESGLKVYSLADLSDLALAGSLPLDEVAVAVAARGDAAFVALRSSNGQGALAAVDTPTPSTMRLRGRSAHAEATSADAASGIAYLLRRDGLHVLDVGVATSPVWLSSFSLPGADFSALDVDGGLAAIAEGREVHLVDVGDPGAPAFAGTATIAAGIAVRPVLAGGYLYVVTGIGLEAFDVSSPSAPAPGGNLSTAGMSSAFAVDGAVGWLVAGEELIEVDLSAPAFPAPADSAVIAGEQLRGVDAAGDLIAVGGLDNLLYTFDVSGPGSPALRGVVAGKTGLDVRLVGDRAVVAAGCWGVRVVDVSDLVSPMEEAWYDTSGEAAIVAVDGRDVYLATLSAQHWSATCDTCTPVCAETWPGIEQNSLRVVKKPVRDTFTWVIAAGVGSSNLHRTDDKTLLPDLWMDMAALAATTPGTSVVESFDPAVSAAEFYRVFGAGACSGASHWP